jgi:PAS domain S-box-containing protein
MAPDSPLGDLPAAEALLRDAPDAIALVDQEGYIRLVNDELTRLLGYQRDELLGEKVERLVPDGERGVHRAHRTRYRVHPSRRPMGSRAELRARRRDGTTVPVEIALSPIERDGRLWIMASMRDVSVRIDAERRERLIRRAIAATREAVFIFDQAGLSLVFVNQGAVDQTGYGRAELLDGMTPLHITPEFTEAEFRDLLQPLVDGELPSRTFLTHHRRRDGTDVPVEITIERPEVDHTSDDGSEDVFVALARDVSSRLAAERRDRSREDDFRAAFEHHLVPTAIVVGAGERAGSIVEVNEQFAELIGHRAEHLRDRLLADIVAREDGPVIEALLDPTTTTPGSAVEARLRTAADGHAWVEMGASPMDDATSPDRIVVQFQDVTAQVEAVSERERHRRALSTLADRERIARDLHDMVIQRLFAAGMGLQAMVPLAEGLVEQRLNETVDTLDETIAELRSTIFELNNPEDDGSLVDRVTRAVELKTEPFAIDAGVTVDVDPPLPEEVVESLLATLTEALANVGRHADANEVVVTVSVEEGRLSLLVEDDGVGLATDAPRGRGIDNMIWRATDLGGRCAVEPGPERGTVLHWEVPLGRGDPGERAAPA